MTTATEYARVSRDKSGRLRSVTEQGRENRDAAEDQGWAWLPTAYAEDGEASASVFGTVQRVGFAALLADLRAGAFPADVLVLWEPSRGSRQLGEWLDLIEALSGAGVRLFVTSEERTYNPAQAKDRRDLIDAANEAEYYSGRLSGVLKRAAKSNARQGRPSGKPPFGYRRVWSEDGKEVSQVVDETAAPYVKEAFERVATGGSIAGLVNQWNETGETGRTWSTQALRALLLNPAYIAVRVHRPRSRHEGRAAGKATEHPAAWPALVERETFDKVQVLLNDPSRLRHRSTGVAHLLTGIAVCGVCGSALAARNLPSRPVLRCTRGCVQITEADVDEFARAFTIRYLQREEVGPPADADAAEVARAKAEVTAAEDYMAEVAQAAEQGLSPLLVAKMEATGERRLQAAQDALRTVSLPDALASALPSEPMTEDVWDGLGLVGQRRLLRALAEVTGPVRVLRGRGDRITVGHG